MTLRLGMLFAVIAFICFEIHLAVAAKSPDLVDHLIFGLMIAVMLPAQRIDKEFIIKLWDKWTNRNKVTD